MNNIIKICSKHGELSEKDLYIKKDNKRCRKCQREWSKNNYEKYKEKILKRHVEYTTKYRKDNPEKVKKYNKKYWDTGIKELKSNYIKDSLSRNSVLSVSEIPRELVDLYKPVLAIKRKLKEKKDNENC